MLLETRLELTPCALAFLSEQRLQRGLQKKEFLKKESFWPPASGLRPLSSGLGLFQVASTMVQILIRDSDLTVRTSLQPVIVIVAPLKIELIQTLLESLNTCAVAGRRAVRGTGSSEASGERDWQQRGER